jgi:hypothetical protein
MAFSTQRVTSDGSLVLLTVALEYFDRTEIAVLFDGVVDVYPWAWVGDTEATISFTPAVPGTVEVMLVRSTDLAEVRHNFTLGAKFTTESLDEDLLQILHIAQEARENATIEEVFHNLNMHGYRIVNIGDGIDPQDAPSMAQMVVHDAQIVVYKDAAAASAVAAAASAAAALASELAAAAEVADALVAHVADADPHTQYLRESDVGSVAQPYDADTAKTDVAQNFTLPQRSALLPDNDGSFDLGAKQNFSCTTAASLTLTFTNQVDGLSGSIVLVVGSGHVVSAHTNTKITTTDLTRLQTAGTYRVDYLSNGTNAYCSVVGPY